MEMLVPLIIQLVAGAIGGNGVASAMKNVDLGKLGNTIVGALGGVGGGQLLDMLMSGGAAAATGGGLDVGAIIGQLVGGGAGGAVLTIVVGLLKNMMAKNA
jgi:hypothetical protein